MKAVKITWVDSTNANYGWHEVDGEKYDILTIETVGYLIYEDNTMMVVSHSVKDNLALDAFSIPKTCIISYEEL